MPATVELRNLRKSYGDAEIIKGVTLAVGAGEFVVFVGPSGCGKSTLLRMVAGLEEISAGELRFDGVVVNEMDPAQRGVGMVFQSYALYPHMTVEENIGFSLRLAKKPRAEVKQRVESAMRVLQLTEMRHYKPSQLSGGQRQRVAIGRAIVRELKVFLFDEPLSNLDASLRGQMRMEIARLHQELKNTVIYVTHDQVEAMTLADRIVVFEGGGIRQVGAPMELYERPANRFVAAFIGSPTMGFLEGTVTSTPEQGLQVILDGTQSKASLGVPGYQLTSGTAVTLGVRPEHCQLCSVESGDLAGTIVMVERLGADSFAFVDVGVASGPFAVRLVGTEEGVAPGKRVGLKFVAAKFHVFDASGEAIGRTS